MPKTTKCSYCRRQRKVYTCEIRLSPHCSECCGENCSGRKRLNLIDESFDLAREIGGASWPSADSTKWAMTHLVGQIAHHLERRCETKLTKRKLISEIYAACGIKKERAK